MAALIRRLACALCAALAAPSLAQSLADGAAPPAKLSTVADLRYGVALYEYYQGHHLQALVELMMGEAKGGIKGHGDNPEIMAGGFKLAYGMERSATDIFTRLLEENRPPATRAAAWYYLARLRYLRGDYPAAEAALDNVGTGAASHLRDSIEALQINLAIRQNQFQKAEALLTGRERSEIPSWPYLEFNLGAAFARAGDYDSAAQHFDQLLDLDRFTEEDLALYDKAMTAAGYARLLGEQPAAAENYFKQVRLDSPFANRALLGFGWAAAARDDYEQALKPWQALRDSGLLDAAAQEGRVALPYAYEQLGLPGLALDEFRAAEASFKAEIERLDAAMTELSGPALREALAIEIDEATNWLNYSEANDLSPQLAYLVRVFADERFLGSAQELRDLLIMRQNLEGWVEKLALYRDLLDQRGVSRTAQRERLANAGLGARLAELEARRDQLVGRAMALDSSDDFLSLVDPAAVQYRDRVLRAEANLALLERAAKAGTQVMPAAELTELADQVRLHKGTLLWRAADQYDARAEHAGKAARAAEQALAEARSSLARLSRTASENRDLSGYYQKIDSAQTELGERLAQLDRAVVGLENNLRAQVTEVLEQQRQRLVNYLAQSRLAVARLLDGQRALEEGAEFNFNEAPTP